MSLIDPIQNEVLTDAMALLPPSPRCARGMVAGPPHDGFPQAKSGNLPPMRNTLKPRGFTLLELMIVISLAALVTAMGLPVFVRAMKKEGLRRAVSDVVEGCSYARSQAILRGAPMEFVIRAEGGSMSVEPVRVRTSDEGLAGEPSRDMTSPSGEGSSAARFSAQLADEVAIKLLYVNFQDLMEFPEARVRFFPNGTSDEFTVILTAADGEQKISLDVVTALADVEVLR